MEEKDSRIRQFKNEVQTINIIESSEDEEKEI